MNEHDEDPDDLRRRFDRIGEGQPRRQHADVVRHGGIADTDADASDVSRDTYGTPLGPGGTGGPADER